MGAPRLPLIDTGVGGLEIFGRHEPEGILDDAGGVMFITHRF